MNDQRGARPPRNTGPTQRSVDPARRAAFDAIQAVTLDDAYANLIIAELLAERGLNQRDAAFATELVYGTLRGLGTYDEIIMAASGRDLADLEAGVIDILRMACHQLLNMRVAQHAAVDSSVDLAALAVGHRVAGLVNAVCRRIARRDVNGWVEFLGQDADEITQMALMTMHPEWIVAAYGDVLPADEVAAALLANNVAPKTTLVIRPGLLERDDLPGEPTLLSPFGTTITGQPGRLDAIRDGHAGVQDEGSQLVAWALARTDAPKARWLDMCAGPGGKAALLLGLARQQGSDLTAVEVHEHRATLVRRALRCYPGIADVVCADATTSPWKAASFAKVMADVPCSGLGALRRRPEARWRHQPEDINDLALLQRSLLRAALDAVQPGGAVAYVTCSPHRAETVDVVTDVVGEGFQILTAPEMLANVADCAAHTDGRFVQLWPHRHGTDAMFMALIRKTA